MTIQRQYSLPNCTLILEGLTDTAAAVPSDFRPLMSILVNAECRLSSREQPLTGGREFFESLVTAVSRYTQEFLSGVAHASEGGDRHPLVQLKKIDSNLHRLIVQSVPGNSPASSSVSPIEIDLNTVQLFDLLDAVDQFFADTRTLPDLFLNLTPVSKSEAATHEPAVRRAMPGAVGVSSLAIAAIAFFLVPPANVRRPTEPLPQSTSSTVSPPGASPIALTDPNQIESLKGKLYERIDKAWTGDGFAPAKGLRALPDTLLFRVSVAPDGTIRGYKQLNQAAFDNVEKTPLSQLVYKPLAGGTELAQSLAEYKVAFTTAGELQVEPWKDDTATPAPKNETTDPVK